MKRLHKYVAVLTLLMVTLPALAGRDYEKERTIRKEYTVDSDATLEIENKYGMVHCSVWDKNVVSIEVHIQVVASSESRAERIMDQIEINISGSSSGVSAETDISSSWSGGSGSVELSIDYTVMMPGTLEISIENAFGDVFVEEASGNAEIIIAHGSLESRKLSGSDNELDISFGAASVDILGNAYVEIEHSSFKIGEVSEIEMDSKHSHIQIDNVNYAEIESRYDDLKIGSVEALNIETRFSHLEIAKLIKSLYLDTQYGGTKIKYVQPGFDNIVVSNSFSGVEIGIDQAASYRVDAVVEFGGLSYPERNAHITKEVEGYTTNIYKGTIGDDRDPSSRVEIRSSNAGVGLKSW